MKKNLAKISVILTIALLACTISIIASAENTAYVSVDFTQLEAANPAVASTISAESVANFRIASVDGVKMMHAIDGYVPTYAVYKVQAQTGKVLSTLALDLVGRICDFGAGDPNLFKVFTSESTTFDWNGTAAYTQTMGTNGSFDQTYHYDLSAAAAGKSELYVAIYLESHASPEWMALKSLSISGTELVSRDVTLNVDFIHSGLPGARLADTSNALEVLKAYKQEGMTMQIESTYALSNADGYRVSYITYKLEAGTGKVFTNLELDLIGRMVANTQAEADAAWLRIYVNKEDNFDRNQWWDLPSEAYVETLKLATGDSDWALDHQYHYDLSELAEGANVVYVTIADYIETTPSRFAFASLAFNGDVQDAPANESSSSSSSSSSDDDDSSPSSSASNNSSEENPETGTSFPVAAAVAFTALTGLAIVVAKRKR